MKPLKEFGDENPQEECLCKERPFFRSVLYLEPYNGVLASLIKSKALLEERGILKALTAYLIQIALESGEKMPEVILAISPASKEERLIKRELEKMLKLKSCPWDKYAQNPNPLIRSVVNQRLKPYCENKTLWLIGLKRDLRAVQLWKEGLQKHKPNEISLIIVSCD